MTRGVTQGSVLGPVIFTMYTAPLCGLIESHNLQNHYNAENSQLCVGCASNAIPEAIKLLKQCLANVLNWLLTNNLSLNVLKIEFLLCGSKQQLAKVNSDVTQSISATVAHLSQTARDLVV